MQLADEAVAEDDVRRRHPGWNTARYWNVPRHDSKRGLTNSKHPPHELAMEDLDMATRVLRRILHRCWRAIAQALVRSL